MLKFIYALAAVATISTQAVNLSVDYTDTLHTSGSAAGAPKTCEECKYDYEIMNYNYHALQDCYANAYQTYSAHCA